MEISINRNSLEMFLNEIKQKFIGTFVDENLSYDDRAWQYKISDEFEKRFIKYSKQDIDYKNFLKVGCFVLENKIYIGLFKNRDVVVTFILTCESVNKLLEIKDIKFEVEEVYENEKEKL